MEGSERIGPYRVIQQLGIGGMGEVVLAHDDRLDRLVAIKRLHNDRAATPHSRERFRREARIAARLNHPAIVQIHDVLHEGDQDYLIMEYVEGQTLRARRDAGPMAVAEVLGIAHQIALGMAVAHDLGVIHRDLKAENILLTRSGRAKITDFGIAKVPGEDTVTAEGAVIGTFRAMSPEQALGRTVDHRSDLFSFGILLYEALTGESPFRSDTPFLTVQRLVLDEPRPIAELVPDVPAALASLLHQLLAKEPMLRPRHFHEVADALIELAGEACDGDCHRGAAFGEPLALGDDRRSTEDRRPTEDELASDGGASIELPAATLLATGGAASAPAAHGQGPSARAARRRWMAAFGAASAPSAHGQARAARAARHRRTAAFGAAVASALCIGYAVHGAGSHPPARAPLVRVAVLSPMVSGAAGHPEVALLAVAVRNAVMSDLRGRGGLELVPWGDINSYVDGATHDTGRPPEQRAIRTAVGADEVVATSLECVLDSCRVTLDRDLGAPGGAPPESFQLAADTAARQSATIAVHLARLYPDHPVRDLSAIGAIDPRDQERYLQLVQSYWAGTHMRPDELLAELDRIRERAPRSIEVLLFEAHVVRDGFLQTEDPAQARRAMALLEAADRLFPDTYDIVSARFDIELRSGRLDDARATLDRLATLDPDSSTTHVQHARLAQARGQLDQMRAELDAAARRDAFSWSVLYYRALLFQRLGDRASERRVLAQLLARSPGNYAGLSLLARNEFESGQLVCAEQHYAQLVAREPLLEECGYLGLVRSKLGRYRDAVPGFRCALQIRPDDTVAQLNLAEALLLAGDADAATAQLRAAHQLLVHLRHDAPGGELHGVDPLVEAQTLAYLGRADATLAAEARTRVAALLAAGRSSAAIYTAALVHAVLGDLAFAARYVTEYLDAGNSPSSLASPWFDPLRHDPVLGRRLAMPAIATTCEATAAP
ncbi:MAG TPA: protein kinase [Kofleriaceae bacterium]|nr:protein kinase [Kofleriaceae bacterium]